MLKYFLCIPAKQPKESNKYLMDLDAKLLDCTNFTARDEIELRQFAELQIFTDDGEAHNHKVDLEQSAAELLQFVCRQYSYDTPLHYEISIQLSGSQNPTGKSPLHNNHRLSKNYLCCYFCF
jgi:hypothetical protein